MLCCMLFASFHSHTIQYCMVHPVPSSSQFIVPRRLSFLTRTSSRNGSHYWIALYCIPIHSPNTYHSKVKRKWTEFPILTYIYITILHYIIQLHPLLYFLPFYYPYQQLCMYMKVFMGCSLLVLLGYMERGLDALVLLLLLFPFPLSRSEALTLLLHA